MKYVPPGPEELARRGLNPDGTPLVKAKPKPKAKAKPKPEAKE